MGQDLRFFIRINDDFVSVVSYSRNQTMFSVFSEVPYERVRALEAGDFNHAIEKVDDKLVFYKKEIDRISNLIKAISEFPNPIEEKIRSIDKCNREREEIRFAYEEALQIHCILEMFKNILKKGVRLYFGYEIDAPTVNDILPT